MRYAHATHAVFRAGDVVIELIRVLRGDLTALISLSLSLFELYEKVRRWLDAKRDQAKEQPLEAVALEAA